MAMRKLHSLGANLEALNARGETPIFLTINADNPAAFRALETLGADLTKHRKYGASLLHDAARWGRLEVLQTLLERDVNVDSKNEFDETPLHFAAKFGHVECHPEIA